MLGIPIARLNLHALLEQVQQAIRTPGPNPLTLAYVNAHSCNLYFEDQTYREAMQRCGLIYVDGNGPRVAAWMAGKRLPRRMTGADWIHDLCARCQRQGYRLYFIGSPAGVAEQAAARLAERYPGLQVVGARDGFFRPEENPALLEHIRRAQPDILLLGMSSPLQETWMVSHAAQLNVPVIWSAGGVFEYASGHLRRAPQWMRALGLEWLGRWLIEPRRLTPRYLVGIPRLLARAATHAWTTRFPRTAPQ